MQRRTSYFLFLGVVLVVVAALFMAANLSRSQAALGSDGPGLQSAEVPLVEKAVAQEVAVVEQVGRQVILQYAVKFVCTEPLQPGQFWNALAAPLVYQKTDVLVHNPWPYPVRLYKKAVEAPLEDSVSTNVPPAQGVAPGKWKEATLLPDYAFRIDCDDITKLLTGDPAATFLAKYGIGRTVEGFVVIGIGQQTVAGTNLTRYGSLDVTADYIRGSEVLKKDIQYQPWWTYWPVANPTNLPWTLGYGYERIVTIDPTKNIDCVVHLRDALLSDTSAIDNPQERNLTRQGLNAGAELIAKGPGALSKDNPAALVPLIGRCQKITTTAMEIDYALVSNIAPNQSYPWTPGRWYDLAVVVPQNIDVDMHQFFYTWQSNVWVASGVSDATVSASMAYYFPYWCGWGYWWWWWNAGDCVDIGVGEGESLDVEQITPSRILVPQWPPTN